MVGRRKINAYIVCIKKKLDTVKKMQHANKYIEHLLGIIPPCTVWAQRLKKEKNTR